jgi:hypothetical protein
MTVEELRQAETRFQRAYRRSETEREQRNAVVREAIAAGWPYSRIAEAMGVSKARVGQIALRS